MGNRRANQRKKSKAIFVVIAILIIAVIAIVTLATKNGKGDTNETTPTSNATQETTEQEKKQVQIYNGTDRPIAVMIDNNVNAWPQAGINDAYMVYEIIVEGGETRLMAVFKGKQLDKIGPIRSSRHYFLDYAMENDALYTHYGWSPQAQSDISTYGVNNINGLVQSEKLFWRDNTKAAPHNAVTSTENILTVARTSGYRTTSDQSSVLKYTTDEVTLENGQDATDVKIPYNSYNVVEYKYNEETQRYTRYSKGKKQTDWNTGEDITTKNIIITFVNNVTISGDEKGRQDLGNIGTKDGYYITNGKAIKITCTKADRKSKTIYKDLDGKEINVNDGNTFMQIVPLNANVTFTN